ncbi:MAG: HlyD family type I secretion periplasmic adaptor subunit [Paracoccaceae bacterium]
MTFYGEPMKITSPTLHATILFTIAAFIVLLVMSIVFKVEVVARGDGRVVPISRVQVVQPEFAARIDAIHVRNGTSVAKGDLLISLDPTDAETQLATLRAETERLEIEKSRILAMVQGLDFDRTKDDYINKILAMFTVAERLRAHPSVAEQRNLLTAQLNDQLASFDQIEAQEHANVRSQDVTKANIERITAALDIQSERLSRSEQLLQQGTTSRSAFLDVQQAFTELERQRDIYFRELDQKIAEGKAFDSERRRLVAEQRHFLLDRNAQIEARLATLTEENRATQRRVFAANLTAPTSGIVDGLTAFTVGGIAEAGAELMRIVPTDVDVEFEGTFSNQDIGFMQVGQEANIGLAAFPSERFGFVKGRVTDIAADSTQGPSDQWGFVVRVKPDQAAVEAGTDRFAIRPGMTASIDVTTDTRRIISYFFAPIVRTIQDSMGER